MKNRRVALLLALPLVALLPFVAYPSGQTEPGPVEPQFVPSEVIIQYTVDADEFDQALARGKVGGVEIEDLDGTTVADEADGDLELVRLPAGMDVEAAVAALEAEPAVSFAEPNWIYTTAHEPYCQEGWTGEGNCTLDPRFDQMWALHNSGQMIAGMAAGNDDADIDAPEAWSHGTGSADVYVGVVDTGIDFSHEDLGAQPEGPIWTNPFDPEDGEDNDGNGYVDDLHGWDFANDDNTIYDSASVDRHGTHVAGTIGAKANNDLGIVGVNWDVTIISAKFLRPSGTTANAVRALDYLTDLKERHGLNIVAVNNSWGGGAFSQALLNAIVRAAQADILIVAAAGNANRDTDVFPFYPNNYDTTEALGYDAVVGVAATTRFDARWSSSNYGLTTVELGAPGSLVLSTIPLNRYGYMSGTSMAAPHVTGVAALVHAALGLTGEGLRDVLLRGVDPVPTLEGRSVTGGRVNAHGSIGLVP